MATWNLTPYSYCQWQQLLLWQHSISTAYSTAMIVSMSPGMEPTLLYNDFAGWSSTNVEMCFICQVASVLAYPRDVMHTFLQQSTLLNKLSETFMSS
jgi:hypothetical protein